jgi:hypothetical protein
MLSSFGFILQQSLDGTISVFLSILFWGMFALVFLLWMSVPFILISIKKEIKALKDEIKNINKDGLD